MKGFMLLITFLMMRLSTFSQDLTPRILESDNDTLYCFTKTQTLEIVKMIEFGIYADSTNRILAGNLILMENAFKAKSEAFRKLEIKNQNLNLVYANQELIVAEQLSFIKQQRKQIKRQRRHKFFLMVGMGVIATTAILK